MFVPQHKSFHLFVDLMWWISMNEHKIVTCKVKCYIAFIFKTKLKLKSVVSISRVKTSYNHSAAGFLFWHPRQLCGWRHWKFGHFLLHSRSNSVKLDEFSILATLIVKLYFAWCCSPYVSDMFGMTCWVSLKPNSILHASNQFYYGLI